MNISFNKIVGKIKPMHSVNNFPLVGVSDTMHHYVGEAGMPLVRLHDTGGVYGMNRYVDVPNIFRNFDADENDPASYDFAFTDWLLQSITAQKAKIFYRLGTSIETAQHIKAYRIYPPKDNEKWARICEHIIMHYNEGWADGFHYGIEYWEIWNEPDNFPDIADNCMWKGSFQEYLELYKTASKYLKERFPNIKIGGYASCGFYGIFPDGYVGAANSSEQTKYFLKCFEDFLKYAKQNNLPLDFFSWHSYSGAEKNVEYEIYARKKLDFYGYKDTESILNEWNPGTARRGTLEDSAYISEMMITMQNTTCDMLMYYNGAATGRYDGLYNPISMEPFKAYYIFYAYNILYNLKNQVEITDISKDICCLAASNGKTQAILITNMGEDNSIKIITDTKNIFSIYRLNRNSNFENDGKTDFSEKLQINSMETIILLNGGENNEL